MHIKNPQSALLSNHEVYLHIQQEEAEYSGADGTGRARTKPKGFKNVLKDTLEYMEFHDQNHQLPPLASTHPTRPMTVYKGPNSLFRALAPHYRLNKAELLQIYNLRPVTQVELQLIIEESHERFSDEELDDMLTRIAAVFKEKESEIDAGAEDQEMEKIANKLLGAAPKKKRRAKKV